MKRAAFVCLGLLLAAPLFGQSSSDPHSSSQNSGVAKPLHPRPQPLSEYKRTHLGKSRLQPTRQFGSAPSPIFFEAPTYGSGGIEAESVAVADVNRDGKPDLLVANNCSDNACANHGSVGVLLGNGDGTFQPAMTYDSGGYSAYAVAVSDVNGDGNLDLIVANECGVNTGCLTGSVGILLGNGDGTFQPSLTYALNFPANDVAAADVNDDGKIDLLVADTQGVEVLLGNGDGSFQPPSEYVTQGSVAVAVADMNGDGKPDLLLAGGANVSLLLGNGDGTFQSPVEIYRGWLVYVTSLAVADVNRDGKLDVVVATQEDDGITGFGSVEVLLGNGDGTFDALWGGYSGGYGASSVAVADVNEDGKPDILVTNPCVDWYCNGDAAVLGVLLGNGDGTFQNAVSYDQGYGAITDSGPWMFGRGGYIAVADVNGDGKADVLATTTNFSSGGVAVLLGMADGSFRAAVDYYPGGFDHLFVLAGDVNEDGKPDILVLDQCPLFSVCPSPLGGFSVGVLLGNGDGTFQPSLDYIAGAAAAPAALALADVNGDGKPDLLTASPSGPVLDVALGNGNGTFQPFLQYALNFSPNYVAAADVNGDGNIDALVADTEGIEVLLGNGDGSFQSSSEYVTGLAESLAVGDVNGDGKLDAVVANLSNGTNPGSVSVLIGNGDGTFKPPVNYASDASAVALADINNDGKLDIVAICCGGVGVLLGNGDGTFQAPLATIASGGGNSIAVADFNGDGKLDVAIGDGDVLLLGNGDGTFQTPIMLGASGLGIATADFNNDGRPDLAVGGVTVLLNISAFSTATTITSSSNPSALEQTVMFTATITPHGSGTPTGTVTFTNGSLTLCNAVTLSGVTATCAYSALPVGSETVTATYSGDAKFGPSISAVSQTIKQASTAVALTSSLNPSAPGEPVTFTATITPLYGGQASGTVTFKDGQATLGSGALSGNVASLTTSSLAIGTHAVAAMYSGDSNFIGSKSVVLNQVVHGPAVRLSPESLVFATQVVFTTSAAKTVTLTNTGLGTLNITSIAATGSFAQTNTCGPTVNPGASCTISVTFSPKRMGTLTGSVTVTDNAPSSPHQVTLTGTGTYVELTPASLNFDNQPVNTTSLSKRIILTNQGSVLIEISGISISGTDLNDFAQTNNCGKNVASGASCFIKVTFTPLAQGSRTADVSISNNGGGSPQKVSLAGTGTP